MSDCTGIKAISFDAAGTLIRLRRPVGEVYAEIAARHGCALEATAADAAFRAVWKTLPARADGPREDDDRDFWRGLVREVFARCGAPPEPEVLERIFLAAYEQYRGATEWMLYPEVPEVLARLATRFPLAVISNYDGRLRDTLAALGVAAYFQPITVSSEVGADKPSPHIFHCTAAALHLPPEEILHVGDEREADGDGPRRAGMRAWLVERPRQDLRDLPLFLGD